MPSYINRTSTPSDTLRSRISRMLSHISPRSTIKYSMKMKRFAFSSSFFMSSNISSPSG